MESLKLLENKIISHAWLGIGSCLFLELGKLSQIKTRKDGTLANAEGEITIHLGFGWRVERKNSILVGGGESRKKIENSVNSLIGSSIALATVVGRVAELQLELSNNLWLVTFSQYTGQPSWDVSFKNGNCCVSVKRGSVVETKNF